MVWSEEFGLEGRNVTGGIACVLGVCFDESGLFCLGCDDADDDWRDEGGASSTRLEESPNTWRNDNCGSYGTYRVRIVRIFERKRNNHKYWTQS